MKILVVNAGSSSLKYQLLDMKDESVIAKGNCDRIGIDGHVSAKTGDGRDLFHMILRAASRPLPGRQAEKCFSSFVLLQEKIFLPSLTATNTLPTDLCLS